MTKVLSRDPLTDREKHELQAGFAEYAVAQTGHHGNIQPFYLSIREDGKLIGAINGQTYWGSLQIDNHWVRQGERHHGYGKQLLEEAEQFALELGAHFITVQTFDVEARDFYLDHGFEIELERAGYEGGMLHLYLLRKEL